MPNDASYLDSLRDYYAQHRVLPSYARIGQLLGFSSKGSVAELVERLKQARLARPGGRRLQRPAAHRCERRPALLAHHHQ